MCLFSHVVHLHVPDDVHEILYVSHKDQGFVSACSMRVWVYMHHACVFVCVQYGMVWYVVGCSMGEYVSLCFQ